MQENPEVFPFPLKNVQTDFLFQFVKRRKSLFNWVLLKHQSIEQSDEKAMNQRVHNTYADNPLSRAQGGKRKVVETRLRIVPHHQALLLQPPAPPTAAQMYLRTR